MAKDLQQLRREAGYRTARELGDACGISQSSMTRYERDPANIPVRSAWALADALGCTVDEVIGREAPGAADMRGEVQKRYDALAPVGKATLASFLETLERQQAEQEAARDAKQRCEYRRMFRTYLGMFLVEEQLGDGPERTPFQKRSFFEQATRARVESDLGDDTGRIEEVMRGLMQAYDDLDAGEFGLV